jgi:hypothetical protein
MISLHPASKNVGYPFTTSAYLFRPCFLFLLFIFLSCLFPNSSGLFYLSHRILLLFAPLLQSTCPPPPPRGREGFSQLWIDEITTSWGWSLNQCFGSALVYCWPNPDLTQNLNAIRIRIRIQTLSKYSASLRDLCVQLAYYNTTGIGILSYSPTKIKPIWFKS